MMYFIVYLVDQKMNVSVPHSWIRDIEKHLEKLGLNSYQNYRVFWTDDVRAFDENLVPEQGFKPNYSAGFTSQFPEEGWYLCRLKRFRSMLKNRPYNIDHYLNRYTYMFPISYSLVDRNVAIQLAMQQRNIVPAQYNRRRLFEHPIPEDDADDIQGKSNSSIILCSLN